MIMDELSWALSQGDRGRYSYPSAHPREREIMQFLDALRDMQPYEGGCGGIIFIVEKKPSEPSLRQRAFSRVSKWFLAISAVASIAGVFSAVSPREGVMDKIVPHVCAYFGHDCSRKRVSEWAGLTDDRTTSLTRRMGNSINPHQSSQSSGRPIRAVR